MTDRAHYPSGEPGTTGREPFEEGRMAAPGKYDGLSGQEGAGGGVLPTGDNHGHAHHGHNHGHEGTSGHGLGSGAGAASGGAGFGSGAGAAENQNFGAEHSTTHGDSYGARGSGIDRTGPLDQEAHKYESTGAGGPTTSGAAGTDRFDVSRDRSGATGDSYGATDSYPEYKEGEKDANKKGSGGIGGLLSTTDKEFTANPSRTGEGAYHDTDGHFKKNTDGPSGQTALTGREGTAENNPVAQAQSRDQGVGAGHGHDSHEKKGLMDKVKDALHK